MITNSASGIASTFKGSREAIQDFNNRATSAATDGLSRAKDTATDGPFAYYVPQATIVSGHAVCPVAANGAPDCILASNDLCKTKGYKEGKKPRRGLSREVRGQHLPVRPDRCARRMQDGKLRHSRDVPIISNAFFDVRGSLM